MISYGIIIYFKKKTNLKSDSFEQWCVIEPNMQVPKYLQITIQKLKNAAVGSEGPENC